MTHRQRIALLLMGVFALVPLGVARAGHIDWDDWYDGDVEVDLRIRGGTDPIVCATEEVEVSVRVSEDAFVLVYAIDPEGYVHLLGPRYWQDSGWIEAGHKLRFKAPAFADPVGRWRGLRGRSCGPVYIQAVASPVPFDWDTMGLGRWPRGALRVPRTGRPGFEFVLDVLSDDREDAVYAVDTSYFYPACHARRDANPRVHLQFVLGWGNRHVRPHGHSAWHRRHHVRHEVEDSETPRKREKKRQVRPAPQARKKEIKKRTQTRSERVDDTRNRKDSKSKAASRKRRQK